MTEMQTILVQAQSMRERMKPMLTMDCQMHLVTTYSAQLRLAPNDHRDQFNFLAPSLPKLGAIAQSSGFQFPIKFARTADESMQCKTLYDGNGMPFTNQNGESLVTFPGRLTCHALLYGGRDADKVVQTLNDAGNWLGRHSKLMLKLAGVNDRLTDYGNGFSFWFDVLSRIVERSAIATFSWPEPMLFTADHETVSLALWGRRSKLPRPWLDRIPDEIAAQIGDPPQDYFIQSSNVIQNSIEGIDLIIDALTRHSLADELNASNLSLAQRIKEGTTKAIQAGKQETSLASKEFVNSIFQPIKHDLKMLGLPDDDLWKIVELVEKSGYNVDDLTYAEVHEIVTSERRKMLSANLRTRLENLSNQIEVDANPAGQQNGTTKTPSLPSDPAKSPESDRPKPYKYPEQLVEDQWIYEHIHSHSFPKLKILHDDRCQWSNFFKKSLSRNQYKTRAKNYAEFHGKPIRLFKGACNCPDCKRVTDT
ncbi:hypothetical protein [Rhodopirellula baltica]|uniref:Uncharacterized protein n=1 Tax=Rhodopirellula baltica SWK14 TaxID=993516 RepID=L7C9J3_RHOBT|nr:hypothetical protein [Rhodopirellula baltica]ELP30849.1 hypothetical protein RBSWK_05115 [Rhodopirellula baltica SWK14]